MIFGTTRIDGRYWLVMLPDGGNSRRLARSSQFGMMVKIAGKLRFHTDMATICKNMAREDQLDDEGNVWTACGRVTRYDEQECNWDCDTSDTYRSLVMGFRPVLVPLNRAAGAPDEYFMARYVDGEVISIGTLYMNGVALDNPEHPIYCESCASWAKTSPKGDCPNYSIGATILIGNTSDDRKKRINFVKTGNCFVADRVILGNLSYQDLESNLILRKYRGPKSLVAGYYNSRRPWGKA